MKTSSNLKGVSGSDSTVDKGQSWTDYSPNESETFVRYPHLFMYVLPSFYLSTLPIVLVPRSPT